MIPRISHIALTALTLLLTTLAAAQDIQFSQAYSNPINLNPAFAGTSQGTRLALNYRIQWPGIDNEYRSMAAGVDQYIKDINGGLGISFSKDQAGIHKLSNTLGSFVYSQHLNLNRKSTLALGVQAGLGQRSFDDSNLFFADQQIRESNTSLDAQRLQPPVTYADISAGLLYYRHNLWLGISAHHVNQPNMSLLNAKEHLLVRLSFQGGWDVPIEHFKSSYGEKKLRAVFNYKSQGEWDQLDLGAYFTLNSVNFGVWYRGIPMKTYKPRYHNHESLVLLLGYEHSNGFSTGYSYDLTTSKLAGFSGGSHEISIKWEISNASKKPKRRIVPCVKF